MPAEEKKPQYQPAGEWWTAPADGDNGSLVMVTGRRDIDKFRKNPKFKTRIEVAWQYEGDASGMPDMATAEMMQDVTERLQQCYDKDPMAVMTGIFTGDNERDWVFYTLSLDIFMRKFNEALAPLPLLPLSFSVEEDTEWKAYDEMSQAEIKFD